MKFRNVPALITLLAAFVSCMVMIGRKYTLFDFLLVLVTVIVVFYVAGLFLRFILNLVFREPKEDEEIDENDDGTVTENESDEHSEAAKNSKKNDKTSGKK